MDRDAIRIFRALLAHGLIFIALLYGPSRIGGRYWVRIQDSLSTPFWRSLVLTLVLGAAISTGFLLGIISLQLLVIPVLLYGLLWLAEDRWTSIRDCLPCGFWLALLVIVVLSSGSITAYEEIVAANRGVGPYDVTRQGEELDQYIAQSRNAFYMLYAGILLVSGITGLLIGKRMTDNRWLPVAGLVLAVLLFLIVTLPYVELLNECRTDSHILDMDSRAFCR